MEHHIAQAKHNHAFHDAIQDQFPDHYFDWKVTSLFYTALHYVRAHLMSQGVDPGVTHEHIAEKINPNRKDAKHKVSKTCWDNYNALYQYSRTARYEGFIDIESFINDRKNDHAYCGEHLRQLMLYLRDRGLKIDVGN